MRKLILGLLVSMLAIIGAVRADNLLLGSGNLDTDRGTFEKRTDTGAFVLSGTLTVPRSNFAAVRLQSGSIFVAGGNDFPTSWQILDQSGNVLSSGSLLNSFISGASTLLTNGNIFLCGGNFGSSLWEINSPTGALVASGSLTQSRSGGVSAVTLNNGNIWISGGGTGGGQTTWEIRDLNGNLVSNGSLIGARTSAKVFVLNSASQSGNVALLGGTPSNSSYEIHSQSGSLLASGALPGDPCDQNSGAVHLSNGNIFLFGGQIAFGTWEIVDQNINIVASGSLANPRGAGHRQVHF